MRRPVTSSLAIAALTLVMMLGACGKQGNSIRKDDASVPANVAAEVRSDPAPNNRAASGDGSLPTDDWVGRWNGPEGLYLDIQPSPDGRKGHYAISNRDNLDREDKYAGTAEGAAISFVRDGEKLGIRPGSGEETGFKYLADKKDCLIVIVGKEGYCR